MLVKLLRLGAQSPGANATWHPDTMRRHDYGKRRVGHPRLVWITSTLQDMWADAIVHANLPNLGSFQPDSEHHRT
eukprot:2918353-Prorocentrum_lima.AAC.1